MYLKPDNLPKESEEAISKLRLFSIYKNLKLQSLKFDKNFQVYEEILNCFVGKKFTFVEIGVLGGGSLLMWREYFGKQARIIGIDLNPEAKKLEKEGFEIFIGSQSSELFWEKFYTKVGKIDVLLDDGGHQNKQQIISVNQAVQNINDGGLIIVEDTHTSYLKKFGNPSKYSFINFSKNIIDKINHRFFDSYQKFFPYYQNKYTGEKKINSIIFFESMVIFRINSKKNFIPNHLKNYADDNNEVADFSFREFFPKIQDKIENNYLFLKKIPFIKKIVRYLFYTKNFFVRFKENRSLKKFFKNN